MNSLASVQAVEVFISNEEIPDKSVLVLSCVQLLLIKNEQYPNSAKELLEVIIDADFRLDNIGNTFKDLCIRNGGEVYFRQKVGTLLLYLGILELAF